MKQALSGSLTPIDSVFFFFFAGAVDHISNGKFVVHKVKN